MFEPENDIERLLMRAATEVAARSTFVRELMDAQIFVVLVPEGAPLVRGPDGKVTVPAGAKLIMPSATRGEERLIPFFTAPSRAQAWFKGEHIVAPDKTRDLFARHANEAFFLNPGSAYGKEFLPDEAKGLVNGHLEQEPRTITTRPGEQILLAHPKKMPTDLIAGLSRELSAVNSVHAAYLMLATRSGEPTWMLGVDHDGSWQDVRAAVGRAVAGEVLGGHRLDALPLDNSAMSATLRTGIPVIAAKRGFFQKLFS
jgi:hypothetical protein